MDDLTRAVLIVVAVACAPADGLSELPAFDSLEVWQQEARELRTGLPGEMHLDPWPQRTPLNAVFHSRREHDGYTVENVYFESIPGYYVTGNLYRPRDRVGPFPAVLSPHGHFREDGWSARTRPDMQRRCATLARMGAVVFAWDMLGWGESTQAAHVDPIGLTLQTWNSLRAIDFVISLPDVDPSRIAISGASGGGSQTILAAALDDRIAASAPVVMVTSHFEGGCTCESLLPLRYELGTNNAVIAALAAPRPQLLVSDGHDWTASTPTREFPWLRSIYELHGAGRLVENVHLPDEGHDDGPSKRTAVYAFIAVTFGLEVLPEPVDLERHESLLAFDDEHPRPAGALSGWTTIADVLVDLQGIP